MAGILDWLLNDPSGSAGGGFLSSLLGANSPAASTMTPTTPAAPVGSGGILGGSGAPYPFRPRTGLLGDSPFADAVRGGLSGMGAANGYSGFGSQLAAGAQGAVKSGRERQMYNLQNQLYGQEFAKGQQGLASGNLGLMTSIGRINWMRGLAAKQAGQPAPEPLTVQQVMADPNLLMQAQGAGSTGDTTQGAPMAPSGGNVGASTTGYAAPSAAPGGASAISTAGAPLSMAQSQPAPVSGQPSGPNAFSSTTGMNPREMFSYGLQGMMYGDPSGKEMMENALKYDPSLQGQLEMAKKGFVPGPDGTMQNVPGLANAMQQQSYATSLGTAQGALGPDLTKIGATGAQSRLTDTHKAGITPVTITVQNPDNTYSEVNTNALAASGGGTQMPVSAGGGAGAPTAGQPSAAPSQGGMAASGGATAAPGVPPGTRGMQKLGPVDTAMMPQLIANIDANNKAAAAASDSLAQLGELRHALDGLPSGPGTEVTNEAAAALQRAGVDINQFLPAGYRTDPTKYAVAAKNFNTLGMAMARANFPGGRITNADLAMAMKATPNFGNNPEANKILLGNIESLQRIKLDRAAFDRQWLKDHGNMPSYAMEDSWKQQLMGMKNVPELLKASVQSYQDLANNPSAPQTPQMHLPQGAIQGYVNPTTKHAIYQYHNSSGVGFYWGDENGKPVK